jgi:hypothetical protein
MFGLCTSRVRPGEHRPDGIVDAGAAGRAGPAGGATRRGQMATAGLKVRDRGGSPVPAVDRVAQTGAG